jgi:membrane-associated phospholipid phosphatase
MANTGAGLERLLSFDAAVTAPLTLSKESGIWRTLALLTAHTGDSPVWAAIFAAVWFLGDPRWRAIVILAVAGMVITEFVVIIVKMSVRRPRPAGDLGGIYRKTDPYSFPSGHSARAAMLSILSGLYCPPLVFAAILVWSPVMLLSRIAIGIHYVLDILAGIVLGAGLTFVVIEAVHWVVARI